MAYGVFMLGLTLIGLTTFWFLRWFEQKSLRDGNKMTR